MGPPGPGQGALRLDLFGALKYAVQNSRDYQDKMEDLYLSALDVTLERHLFAPRPFAKVGAEYTGGQKAVDYRSALAATASLGVKQQLPYGGEIDVETLVKFVNAFEGQVQDGETADIAISGSIPLLRGAGMVNLEPLIASERELIYSVRTFEAYRRSFAVSIASQYFGLLAQQQSISNRMQNYATLASLLERRRRCTMRDGYRHLKFNVPNNHCFPRKHADRRPARVRQRARQLQDRAGDERQRALDVTPVVIDVATPDMKGTDGIKAAYQYRLEIQTAHDRVSDSVRRVEVAKNGLLPDLSLTARTTVGNPNRYRRPRISTRARWNTRRVCRSISRSIALPNEMPIAIADRVRPCPARSRRPPRQRQRASPSRRARDSARSLDARHSKAVDRAGRTPT